MYIFILMKIYELFICLITLPLSNSFNLNPLKFSINNDNNIGDVRIIQSSKDKPDKSIIFIPAKMKKEIPSELYNNFLHNVAENNVKIYIPNDDIDNTCTLINKLQDKNEKLILVAHSSGAQKALDICLKNKKIENVVLIDPLDLGEFNSEKETFGNLKILENFVSKFTNNNELDEIKESIIEIKEIISENREENTFDVSSNGINNLLVLKTEKSGDWKLFPTVPPINRKSLDTDSLVINGKKNVIYNKFGHFDILDNNWSDFIHNTISKGNENRNPVKLNEYHKYLADKINKVDNIYGDNESCEKKEVDDIYNDDESCDIISEY